MKLAFTMAPADGEIDLTLQRLADTLIAGGYRVAGTVQINTGRTDGGPCDMDVRVLPRGPVLRISQSLGRGSRGCRLDPAALERAVGLVEAGLAQGADCLLVNKFGKHEAEGRGFRPLIATALQMDLPVLVGLNSLNRAAFLDFADNTATELTPDVASLEHWIAAAVAARPAATVAAS